MQNIERLKILFVLVVLVSSSLLILSPAAHGQGSSSLASSVELKSGKLSGVWTSGSEYYKINILSGQTVSINLDLIFGTDVDIYLYDPDSTDDEKFEVASSTIIGNGDDENIKFTASKSGFHYLKLTGQKYSGSGAYDLTVFVTQFDVLFSDWGTQINPLEVAPGDFGTNLQIVLRNSGPFDISDLSIDLSLPDTLSNRTGGNSLYAISTTNMISSSTNTFNFLVNVNEQTDIETIYLPMIINYQAPDNIKGIEIESIISVHITGRSFINFESSTQVLSPKVSNDVDLTIKNEGTASTGSIDLSLTIPSPLNLLGSDNKWKLTSLQPGEELSITTSIFAPKSSAGQYYQIIGNFVYDNTFGQTISETRTISLRVDDEPAQQCDIEANEIWNSEKQQCETVSSGIIVVETFWGSPTEKISVEPGDNRVKLNVVIQNRDDGAISGIQGNLILRDPFASSNGDDSLSSFFGSTVSSGSTSSADFLLNIDKTTHVGTYDLTIEFSYLDKDSILRFETLLFSVDIDGKSNLETTISNNIFTSGTKNELSFAIENLGTAPVYSVTVSISYGSSSGIFSTSNQDNSRKITQLLPNARMLLSFPTYVSPTASQGLYPISFIVEYRDINGIQKTESQEFGILVKDWSSPFSITVPDNILLAGRVTSPSIDIKNTGDNSIHDMKIELQFPTLQSAFPIFLNSGNAIWEYSRLNSGESLLLDPEIFSALSSSDTSFVVQIQISYLDEHGFPHTEVRAVGFTVRGMIDLTYNSIEFSLPVIPAGANATIVGNLLNQGNDDAKFLTISIMNSDDVIVNSESSQYIAEIDEDGLIPFSLKFAVDDSSNDGFTSITLVINYEDTYGNKYSTLETFTFEIGGNLDDLQPIILEEPSGPVDLLTSPYAIVGVGTFVILLTIIFLRRRGNDKPF